MGRAWRIEFEGALYHILSRGNERKGIFYDDKDRYMFLKAIGEMSELFKAYSSKSSNFSNNSWYYLGNLGSKQLKKFVALWFQISFFGWMVD